MNTYSLSTLKGTSRCNTKRNNPWKKKEVENTSYIREEMVKKAVLGYLQKKLTLDQARACLNGAYEKDNFPDIVKKQKEEDLWTYVRRYLQNETRFPQEAPATAINIWGVDVNMQPDFYFWDGRKLEVVKLRLKKPDITQNGRKLDASAANSLDLYALLYYAKQLIPYIAPGVNPGNIAVVGSYYYLMKQNDSFEKDQFDLDFFDKAGRNVISISDIGAFPTQKDQHYGSLYSDFKRGEDKVCTKNDCKNCELYGVCSNAGVPVPVKKTSLSCPIRRVKLTKSQKDAVAFEHGIARINAGAGTGKTLVVALRVVNLLMKGYRPEEIVILTFSNNGAAEMTGRIKDYCAELNVSDPESLERMTSMTFNSLGDELLRQTWRRFGFTSEPILIDEGERLAMIEELVVSNPVDGLNYRNFRTDERYVKGGLAIVSKVFDIFKNYRIDSPPGSLSAETLEFINNKLDADSQHVTDIMLQQLSVLYQDYKRKMLEENYIEYADQEWLVFDLAAQDPEFFKHTGYKHIIVDEFQDSNPRQMQIIKLLAQSNVFTSLMVVGDDSQAIYGFRETSPYNIIHFFEEMGVNGKDFYLLENHRSTPEILGMANCLNKMNKVRIPKDLVATRPSGKAPFVQAYVQQDPEYNDIAESIKNQIASGRKPEEIAFIAMTKSELLKMKDKLDSMGIKSSLIVPEPVGDNPLVQGAKALFDLMSDPKDEVAALTYLNSCGGPGYFKNPQAAQYVQAWIMWSLSIQETTSNSEKYKLYFQLLEPLLSFNDEIFQKFYESLAHKKTWGSVCSYFANAAVYGEKNEQKRDLSYPGVALTTAHSSKGLEWPVCYVSITKFDNELLRSPTREEEREERRRLLFVAITRAKDELYVTGKYYSFGDMQNPTLNMFMGNLYDIQGRSLEAEFMQITKKRRAG